MFIEMDDITNTTLFFDNKIDTSQRKYWENAPQNYSTCQGPIDRIHQCNISEIEKQSCLIESHKSLNLDPLNIALLTRL